MASLIGARSGLAIAEQSVWGTAVATTRGLPISSESIKYQPTRIDTGTMKGGTLIAPHTSIRNGPSMWRGQVQTQLFNSGATLLWEAMLGSISTDATNDPVFAHTATLGEALPFYSMDVAFGRLTGTKVKRLHSGMVESWELGFAQNAAVTLGLEWVFGGGDIIATGETNDDLAGTYPTGQAPYITTQTAFTIDASTVCLEAATVSGANNLKISHCLGVTSIRQPTRNGRPALSGSLTREVDDTDNTIFDKFVAGSLADLVITASNGTDSCVVTATVRYDGGTPTISGAETLMETIPFTVLVDDGNSDDDADAFNVVITNGDAAP